MRQAYDYWQDQPGSCRLGTGAGRGFTSPGTLEPQTFLAVSAVLRQPDNRQLCPSVNITTLCKAWRLLARSAKPTPTLYSLAGCVANLPFSVQQPRRSLWLPVARLALPALYSAASAASATSHLGSAAVQLYSAATPCVAGGKETHTHCNTRHSGVGRLL